MVRQGLEVKDIEMRLLLLILIVVLTMPSTAVPGQEQKQMPSDVIVNINTQPAHAPAAAPIAAIPEPTDWVDVTWKSAAGIAVGAVVVSLAARIMPRRKKGTNG